MPLPRLLLSRSALVLSWCLLAVTCTATAPVQGPDLPDPGEVSPRRAQ